MSRAIAKSILVAASCITSNTEVKPVNAPTEISPATQFCPVICIACAIGAWILIISHLTTPVKTSATNIYTTVHANSVPIMPIGTSFCGFLVSSAAVEIASKTVYAKKIVNALIRTLPSQLGMKGTQFPGFT